MFTLEVSGREEELAVVRVSGEEAISKVYRFDVTVVSPNRALSFRDFVGRDARLTIHGGGEPRYVHGIVARFEHGDEGKQSTSYELTIAPRLVKLAHRRASRIFQEKTTRQIVTEVLDDAGLATDAIQLALQGAERPREYCVQYRETDLDFIQRLLEEDGIHYFFTHAAGAATLVLADGPAAHAPIAGDATVPFRPPSGAIASGEHVRRFRFSEEVRAGRASLSDYDFKRPSLSLAAASTGPDYPDLELYDHPGDYDDPGAGSDLARARLEEQETQRRRGRGEGACPRLTPGHVFTLSEHTRDDLNRAYLVTRVEHEGQTPAAEVGAATSYDTRFEVVPGDAPYRPPRTTPRPTVKGIQTAVVVGPPGEEIYTDEHGRVKVQFHWDRDGKRDDKSSCWIRVSQASAGSAWGSVFLPRVGHEVVVDFIDGDPDRPLIVGSVYHGTNVPPYALPGEKTKSAIKTNSSPGGGGSNEIRFEDKKGSEEVYLHAEKDLAISVEHDKDQEVEHDETLRVGHDRTVTVEHNHTETVAIAQTVTVGAAQTITVGAAQTITVGGAKTETVGAMSTETVVGLKSTNVGLAYTMEAGLGINMAAGVGIAASAGMGIAATAGMGIAATAGQGVTVTAGKDVSLTAGGSINEQAAMNYSLVAGQQLTIQCGTAQVVITQAGGITIQGTDITVKANGSITLDTPKLSVQATGTVTVTSAASVKIQGSTVDVN
jgi:type VI secretion system secreted protein VgrG